MQCGDLSSAQAENAAKSILFENSNNLYRLDASLNGKYLSSYSLPISVTRTKQAGTSHNQLSAILQRFSLSRVCLDAVNRLYSHPASAYLPIDEFVRIARKQQRVGISLAVFWMLQDDHSLAQGVYSRTILSGARPFQSLSKSEYGILCSKCDHYEFLAIGRQRNNGWLPERDTR